MPSDLARIVPAADAAVRHSDIVAEPGLVLDAIERWLAALTAGEPVLLVVEDLHWSTSSTHDVLRHLVRRGARRPLLVIVTTRDSAPDLRPPLDSLLGELQRSPAVTRLRLDGLDEDDVAALLRSSAAHAAMVVAQTGGNPLLVTHVTDSGNDASLATLLRRREELLDGEDRAVLDLAATLGAEFDADLLAAGHGAPLLSVLESLERAEAAGLVVPLPGAPGRFGFVHALFRSHRYERLPMRRRLELHASAATAMAARPGDERLLSEHARHACLAVPVGDARTAVDLAREAAHRAERAYAYDEAASHYRRGLDAAGALVPPDGRAALDLTVRLAAALHRADDRRGLPMLLDAADRARREGDDAALVRAASSFTRFGGTGLFSGPVPAQLAVIEDALDVLGPAPSAMRAHLLVELTGQIGDVRVGDSIELIQQAEAIARALADDDLLGHVLLSARLLGRHPSRLAEYERIGRELSALGARRRSLVLTVAGGMCEAGVHLERGELRSWRAGIAQAELLIADRNFGFVQLMLAMAPCQQAFLDGDLDAAEEALVAVRPIATAAGHPPRAWMGGMRIDIARLRARDVETVAPLERADPRGAYAGLPYSLAAAHGRVGSVDEARLLLGALRADGYPMHDSYGWPMAMTELAEAAEVAGDADAADHVLAQCSPYSGRIAVAGPSVGRPFDQALAQAALAVGDPQLADSYAARAVVASRARRTPLYLARELVFLAAARRRGGASAGAVRPLVDEALTLAEPRGAGVVRVDVERYGLPT